MILMANQNNGGNSFWQIINMVGNFPPCRPAKNWIYPDIPENSGAIEKPSTHNSKEWEGGGYWQYIMTRPYRSSDLCYTDKYLIYTKLSESAQFRGRSYFGVFINQ